MPSFWDGRIGEKGKEEEEEEEEGEGGGFQMLGKANALTAKRWMTFKTF